MILKRYEHWVRVILGTIQIRYNIKCENIKSLYHFLLVQKIWLGYLAVDAVARSTALRRSKGRTWLLHQYLIFILYHYWKSIFLTMLLMEIFIEGVWNVMVVTDLQVVYVMTNLGPSTRMMFSFCYQFKGIYNVQ